jgi:hypothetical protein
VRVCLLLQASFPVIPLLSCLPLYTSQSTWCVCAPAFRRRRMPSSGYLSAELSEMQGTTSAGPLPQGIVIITSSALLDNAYTVNICRLGACIRTRARSQQQGSWTEQKDAACAGAAGTQAASTNMSEYTTGYESNQSITDHTNHH